VFRAWKNAFLEAFKWAKDAEALDYKYVLISQVVLSEELQRHGTIHMNAFSIGIFVIKKCMEDGGADMLLRNCVTQRDVSDLIADFYSMMRLYNDTFPKMLEWRERCVAQRNMVRQGMPQR